MNIPEIIAEIRSLKPYWTPPNAQPQLLIAVPTVLQLADAYEALEKEKKELEKTCVDNVADLIAILEKHGLNSSETLTDVIGRLVSEREALEKEGNYSHELIMKQAGLLTRAAIALRGPEPELTRWSHHDIAERINELTAERDALRAELAKLKT